MAWSFNSLSVKEMTEPMIRGAVDELLGELSCRESHCADDERKHFTAHGSCLTCGCHVIEEGRRTHIEWHKWHRRVS